MYRCAGCGKITRVLEGGGAKCPYCGARLLFKVRPEVVRRVKAR